MDKINREINVYVLCYVHACTMVHLFMCVRACVCRLNLFFGCFLWFTIRYICIVDSVLSTKLIIRIEQF